ncbi:MAG: tetratricopeptide repeat protein [Burkholderiales bacterium]|nr:tetratricopeptide repeat protein [Burkholderiales bacterium]
MSVINQMLVELERRRASGIERNRIPDHVRALPGDASSQRLPLSAIAVALAGVALLAAGAWWWMQQGGGLPQTVPVAAGPALQEAPLRQEEWIARRLTLDLSQQPEAAAETPAPIATAAIVAPRAASPAPAQKPVETEVTAAPRPPQKPPSAERVVAEKPPLQAAITSPPVTKVVPRPVAEIDKQVREPTLRQRAESEYARGTVALHQGQFAEARSAFEAALQVDATHHAARQALVGVLLDGRRHADAARVLQEGLQLSPAQHGFAMTLARLQVEAGELDAGAQTLARSLEYPGASPDHIAFHAGLLQRQQKHAEAVAQFQQALSRRGGVGVWLLGLGVSLEALGRTADAQEAYRRARASGNLSADLQAFAEQRLR